MKTKTQKPQVTRYVTTNGLMATGSDLFKPTMVKIWFAIMDNDTVVATVCSANNGNRINAISSQTMTYEEFCDMPSDPYNSMIFNEAAFELFELSFN